jgi:ParB family chromosome partitioning protein
VIETATAYLKLRDQFSLTLEQIGQRVGKRSVSAISNVLRLLKLPKDVRTALAEGKVTEGQVRPLIGLDDAFVSGLLPTIIKEQWPSRRVEQYVVDLKKSGLEKVKVAPKVSKNEYEADVQRLVKTLQADVRIQTNSKGAGKITIAFKSEEEFRRIEKLLEK